MDYAALFAAGVAGLVIGSYATDFLNRKLIASQRSLLAEQDEVCGRYRSAIHALNALRSNCFLTDTDGVRRRYGKVSRAVRERAEGSN